MTDEYPEIWAAFESCMKNTKSLTTTVIKKAFLPLLPKLIFLYEEDLLVIEEDYRSGEETHGYASEESNIANFHYISDRWIAAFRVRWLIQLVDPGYYLHRSFHD